MPRLAWLAAVAIVVGDADVAQVQILGASLSAIVTFALAVGILFFELPIALASQGLTPRTLGLRDEISVGRRGLGLVAWLFLGWAALDTLIQGEFTKAGVQNLCCYVIFICGAAVIAMTNSPGSYEKFVRLITIAGSVRALVYGVVLVRYGVNSNAFYSARAFAIQALLIMAVLIPFHTKEFLPRLLPYLLFVEIVLSESRTAIAVAAVLLLVTAFRGRRQSTRVLRLSALIALTIGISAWTVMNVPSIQDRLFSGDQFQGFGFTLNTEGRAVLWRWVLDDIATSPWLGHGAGHATNVIRTAALTAGEPHNDYLRILDDFGLVGLVLWLISIVSVIVRAIMIGRAYGSDKAYTAALAIFAVSVVAATDNVLIYYFAMLPLGALLGMVLSERGRTTHLPPQMQSESRTQTATS